MNVNTAYVIEDMHYVYVSSFGSDLICWICEYALFGGACFPNATLICNCMTSLKTWHVSQNVIVLFYSYEPAIWNFYALDDTWNDFLFILD